MTDRYHEGQREFQDRFDTRRLADRLAEAAERHVRRSARRFIEARDMFFIASTDADGSPDCSYKGGDPGFVRVIDDSTLAFPVFDGNGMFLTLGNLAVNPRVGLLFIDFETGTRLRVNGDATIDFDDPLDGVVPRGRSAWCGSGPDRSSPTAAATSTSTGRCRRRRSSPRRRRPSRARLEARPVVRRDARRRRPGPRPAASERAGDSPVLSSPLGCRPGGLRSFTP